MKIKKSVCIASGAMLMSWHIAFAVDCDSGKTADMNACAAAELKKVDTDLNRAYNAYRAKLNPQQKEQLKTAQLAWIKFRDASCVFESSGAEGGSIYATIYTGCLAEKTRIRLKEIQGLANCAEGDLSCPRG